MQITDRILSPKANNFTILRLILASAVIYTHSVFWVLHLEETDDFSRFLGQPISYYAVDGFFFLSGFLVYPSLTRLGTALEFAKARLTRLWPALALVIGVTVLAGLKVTNASPAHYIGGETARFIFGNLSFIHPYYTLTGVNCGTDLCVVNGSIWTIPWEVRCYAALAILSLLGLTRPRAMTVIILPLTILGWLIWDIEAVRTWCDHVLGHGPTYFIRVTARLWPVFALGAASYVFRERLRLSWLFLAGLLILDCLTINTPIAPQTRDLFIGYAVLCLGLYSAKGGSLSGNWPDYSYGMYLYGWPAMLIASAVFKPHTYLALTAETCVLALPAAMISWHALEKPALDALKRARQRAKAARIAPQSQVQEAARDPHAASAAAD